MVVNWSGAIQTMLLCCFLQNPIIFWMEILFQKLSFGFTEKQKNKKYPKHSIGCLPKNINAQNCLPEKQQNKIKYWGLHSCSQWSSVQFKCRLPTYTANTSLAAPHDLLPVFYVSIEFGLYFWLCQCFCYASIHTFTQVLGVNTFSTFGVSKAHP